VSCILGRSNKQKRIKRGRPRGEKTPGALCAKRASDGGADVVCDVTKKLSQENIGEFTSIAEEKRKKLQEEDKRGMERGGKDWSQLLGTLQVRAYTPGNVRGR